MKIGELSRRTKVSIRSLRYYEQQGLIAPERRENGYREYNPFSVEQVETIKFYLDLGMTTAEISGFLQCVLKNKEAFCNEIMPIYQKARRRQSANRSAYKNQNKSGTKNSFYSIGKPKMDGGLSK